jgi:PadR family transcriptional regulator, regulatory protein PadR
MPQVPGSGKRERYIQPSILLGLLKKPSYGYELIHSMQNYGFVEGQAPPGMIYRHLRQLEEDGLVISKWETQGAGAARRMYTLTSDGEDILSIWIDHMERQAESLNSFIKMYAKLAPDSQ